MVLLGAQAARRGELAEAICLFETAASGDPPLAVARLQLAHALIARAAGGLSVVAVNDRLRAQDLALEVQREVRRWSGPSEKALSVLLKAHRMIGAFKEAVRLASPESLGGAASDREASFGEVAVAGAEAAVAMRNRSRAAGFATLVPGTSAELFIRALVLDPSLPAADQAIAWREALAGASTFEQQRSEFADKLAQRHSLMIPAEDADYEQFGQAFPDWEEHRTDAILQPPRPQIAPSGQVLERITGRDLDIEAAD